MLEIAEDDGFLIDFDLAIIAVYLDKVCLEVGKEGLGYFRVAKCIMSSL